MPFIINNSNTDYWFLNNSYLLSSTYLLLSSLLNVSPALIHVILTLTCRGEIIISHPINKWENLFSHLPLLPATWVSMVLPNFYLFLGKPPLSSSVHLIVLGAHPIPVPEKDTWPRSSQSEYSNWAGLWGQWLGPRWACGPFKTMNDEPLSRSPFSPLGWLRDWDMSLKLLGLPLLLQRMSSWGENQIKTPDMGQWLHIIV